MTRERAAALAAGAIVKVRTYSRMMVSIELWLRPWCFGVDRVQHDNFLEDYLLHLGPLTFAFRHGFHPKVED